MKEKPKLNISAIKGQTLRIIQKVGRYKLVLFVAFVFAIYAYVFLHINNYSNQQPSQTSIDNQVKSAAIPRIDPTAVKKIQSLQDNSVSVQSLFNQARTS